MGRQRESYPPVTGGGGCMGEVVLVTGASGFIGSHIVANLLARGKSVRASVRNPDDPEKVDHLKALPVAAGGSLELVEMDLFDNAAVNSAVAGCSDVIHAAAALHVGNMDKQKDVVDPSLIGSQNICDAIDSAGTVKRLVHTSSTAAIRTTHYDDGQVFTAEMWADDKPLTLEDNAYGLAKTEAERLVRKWHSNSDPATRPRLVTIHPCVVFGPPLTKRHLSGSLSYVEALVKRTLPKSLPVHINIVDVRDVAEAHVRALSGGAEEGRYLVVGGDMWMVDLANVLREGHPERKWPKGVLPYWMCLIAAVFHPKMSLKWARNHLRKSCTFDASPAERELEMTFRSPAEAAIDSIPPMVQNGWV
jgi:nucleoside-diphosphate-sugar epimerase